jgi:hypothetical protein
VAAQGLSRRTQEVHPWEPNPVSAPVLVPVRCSCLDVRTNDEGDLVVTKGDKYDVREKDESPAAAADVTAADSVAGASVGAGATAAPVPSRAVRNLGKPVDLCARYYAEGADEVVLLNITAFRSEPLDDAPLLGVLEAASERVFVPLTVRRPGAAWCGWGLTAACTALHLLRDQLASRRWAAGWPRVALGAAFRDTPPTHPSTPCANPPPPSRADRRRHPRLH